MQKGHNWIFLKIYLHGDFTYSDHDKKQILINNIINEKYMKDFSNIYDVHPIHVFFLTLMT